MKQAPNLIIDVRWLGSNKLADSAGLRELAVGERKAKQSILPILYGIKGFFVRYVVHEYETHGSSVIGSRNGSIAFLSCRVLLEWKIKCDHAQDCCQGNHQIDWSIDEANKLTHICNLTRLSFLNTVLTLKSMPTVLTKADVNESSA